MIETSPLQEMAMAGVRIVASLGALLLASGSALAGDPASQIEVKVLSGGVVVATALLPSDSSIKITATSISGSTPAHSAISRSVTTAAGHATLVASQGGKEVLTLNGDQLEVTGLPQ
jgi:hypothetical protein